MKRPDDSTGVAHIAGGFLYGLREILNLTPRAICGASLIADCTAPEPGPDSAVCADCYARRPLPVRLRSAYLNLWLNHPRTSTAAVLAGCAIVIASGSIAMFTAHKALIFVPVGVLALGAIAMPLTGRDDPCDDESDGAK